MQIVALGPTHKALSKVPNKKDTWELHLYSDTENLKVKILQDPSFIKKWATIAHFLGFASCGGTGSPRVGEDFSFEKGFEKDNSGSSHEVYYLKANYNGSDPYAKGYRANEGLQMKISNVRLIIDPNTLKFGEFRTIDTKPIMIASAVLENTSDKDNDVDISFIYASNKSWSMGNDFRINEKIGVKTKFSVDIPLSENKGPKLNVEFALDKGWNQSEGIAMTEINNVKHYDKIEAKSKRKIDFIGTVKRSEVPYVGRIYIEYDITFTGFLRASGNAHVDHPNHRPTKSITFGGRKGMSATEDLLDIYSNRHRKGYSEWDWKWIIDNFDKKNIKSFIKEFCRVKRGGEIIGVFNVSESTAPEQEPNNTMIEDERFSKENKVEIKDFKYFKTSIFDVKGIDIK